MSAAVPLLLALALPVGPAAGAGAETGAGLHLEADRITVDGQVVTGEGSVRAVLLGGEVTAERFEVQLDGSGAIVEHGCWVREGERACFETLELLADGNARLDRAILSLCGCEGGVEPWSVRAWRVTVDPDRSAVFVGGVLRVAGCPLIPIPAGVFPLGPRRSGLLAPHVGWTPDGLELAQPLYLTLGRAADWTLEPTWRQQRGLRLGNELRWALPGGGGGQLRAVGGWDALEEHWRGMAAVEHGWVERSLRTAASGSIASDASYRDDFEADFAVRQQGFHEARALVGWGPFRLDHDGFQDADGQSQRLVGLAYSRPAGDSAALSPSVSLDLSLGGYGPSRLELDTAWLAVGTGAGLSAGRPLGPLEGALDLWGTGLLLQPLEGDSLSAAGTLLAQARVAGEGELTLPMWADHGSLRHLLRPSLVVGGSQGYEGADLEETMPLLTGLPLWWVGPRVESRWLASSSVPVHLRADLPVTDEGLAPGLLAWWSRGPWWGRVQGSAHWEPSSGLAEGLAWVEAGRRTEAFRVALGVAGLQQAEESSQLTGRFGWRLPLGADRWEPRARARWSIEDRAFVEQHLGLYFASRCDCLGVEVNASWAEDRGWPDLGLRLDLGR